MFGITIPTRKPGTTEKEKQSTNTTTGLDDPVANLEKTQTWELEVQVCSAEGLRAADRKSSDPFVVLSVGSVKKKTSTKRRFLNPTFDESFQFKRKGPFKDLLVQVLDKDTLMNDSLGTFRIDPRDLETDRTYIEWFELGGGKGKKKATGKVQLRLCLKLHGGTSTRSNSENTDRSSAVKTISSSNSKLQGGPESGQVSQSNTQRSLNSSTSTKPPSTTRLEEFRCRVSLVQAKGLPPADRNGLADPYAVLLIGTEKHKSSVKKKTLEPHWNEVFEFGSVKKPCKSSDSLVIKIFDKDFVTSECLGMVTVNDLERVGSQGIRWRTITDKNGNPTGEVQVAISCIDTNSGSSSARSHQSENQEEWLKDGLRVGVIEARNLCAADRSGQSDPYCVVQIGKQKLRSSTIKRNLNPQWNENMDFAHVKNKITSHTPIRITLFDDDLIGDDFLGCFVSTVGTLVSSDSSCANSSWYPLSEQKATKSSKPLRHLGEVCLSFQPLSTISEVNHNANGEELVNEHAGESQIKNSSSKNIETTATDEQLKQVESAVRLELFNVCKQQSNNGPLQILEGFLKFDIDNKGEINIDTFVRMLEFLGVGTKSPQGSLAKVVSTRFQLTSRDTIRFNGFYDFLIQSRHALTPRKGDELVTPAERARAHILRRCSSSNRQVIDLEKLYQDSCTTTSSNGNQVNELNRREFTGLLHKAGLRGNSELSSEDVKLIFDVCDTNADGVVSYLEFETFVIDCTANTVNHSFREAAIQERLGIAAGHEKQAKLFVRVLRASGLRSADRNGKSDPFCVLFVGREKYITKVVPKTLDPVWEQEFEFGLKGSLTNDMSLEIQVKDRDLIVHDMLGKASLPISSLPRLPPEKDSKSAELHVLKLEGGKGKNKATGEVSLEIALLHAGPCESLSTRSNTSTSRELLLSERSESHNNQEADTLRTNVPRLSFDTLHNLESKPHRNLDEYDDKSDFVKPGDVAAPNLEIERVRTFVMKSLKQAGYNDTFSFQVYFSKKDKHGKGYISTSCFLDSLERIGVVLRRPHRKVLLPRLDPGNKSRIDYGRFCSLMGNQHGLCEAETVRSKLKTVFASAKAKRVDVQRLVRSFDTRDTGLIHVGDLSKALLSLGAKVTPTELITYARNLNSNNDGFVDILTLFHDLLPVEPVSSEVQQAGRHTYAQNEGSEADVFQVLESLRHSAQIHFGIRDRKPSSIEQLERLLLLHFGSADRYGNGVIRLVAFRAQAEQIGLKLDPDQTTALMAQFGASRDINTKCIDYVALTSAMLTPTSCLTSQVKPESDTAVGTSTSHVNHELVVRKLKQAAEQLLLRGGTVESLRLDSISDLSGKITRFELRQYLLKHLGANLDEAQIRYVMDLTDVDCDGTVVVADLHRLIGLDELKGNLSGINTENTPSGSGLYHLRSRNPMQLARLSTGDHDWTSSKSVSELFNANRLTRHEYKTDDPWDPMLVSEWLATRASEMERQEFDDLYRDVSCHMILDNGCHTQVVERHRVRWLCDTCGTHNETNPKLCECCGIPRRANAFVETKKLIPDVKHPTRASRSPRGWASHSSVGRHGSGYSSGATKGNRWEDTDTSEWESHNSPRHSSSWDSDYDSSDEFYSTSSSEYSDSECQHSYREGHWHESTPRRRMHGVRSSYSFNHDSPSRIRRSAHLQSPSYRSAHLQSPSYRSAHLQSPSYRSAHLQSPSYRSAHLQSPSHHKGGYSYAQFDDMQSLRKSHRGAASPSSNARGWPPIPSRELDSKFHHQRRSHSSRSRRRRRRVNALEMRPNWRP